MPKLLWVSPLSIHDTASSSAIQMRNMLLSLRSRNVEIVGLSALNFVHESGTSLFTDLDEKLKGKETSFNLNDNDIRFFYIRTKSRNLGDMISQEQRNFYAKFCALIPQFRPDVVMGTGTDMLSMVCFDEAKRRGIPTVYTLLDGTPRRFNFPNIDLVITDSIAISQLYAKQFKINAVAVGSFLQVNGPLMNPLNAQGKLSERGRTRITMINPALEKGLAIFMKLARLAMPLYPDYQFAVYEQTEGQFAQNVVKLHKRNSVEAAFSKSEIADIEVIKPDVNGQDVLDTTKALILPSVSFERINLIAREAIANGIPVLGSNVPGISESVGSAGLLADPPQYCIEDPTCVPEDIDMQNFMKGLQMVLTQDFSERISEVCKHFNIANSGEYLSYVLKPLFDRRAGDNPQLLRNGSLI